MKKLMNDPANFVEEALQGIILTHSNEYKFVRDDYRGIVRSNTSQHEKVSIVTGGGFGHLPLFLGFVGHALADGVAVGNVFTSPSADTIYNVSKEVNNKSGILFLYGNYFGDTINFDLAADMLKNDKIDVESAIGSDDIASASRKNYKKRRGVAGLLFAYQTAGASANSLDSLDKVKEIAEKTISNTVTMGVSLSPCTLPDSDKPAFTLEGDEVGIGMGIHGEPGIKYEKIKPDKEISKDVLTYLLEDLQLDKNDKIALLINGSGATPLEELYIVAKDTYDYLNE